MLHRPGLIRVRGRRTRGPSLRITLRRTLLTVFGLQLLLAIALTLVDSYRRRGKSPKPFETTDPTDVPIGDGVVTSYTFGQDLYEDMLAAIEDLLDTWPGTLLVVSHDRYLLERVTDQQYAVLDGRLRHLPGGVEEYLKIRSGTAATAPNASAASGSGAGSGSGSSATPKLSGAEKRSVICVLIAELWSAASRRRAARRLPIRRAGTRNTGSMTTASTVTSHEVLSMTIRVRTSATTFVTTPESVPLKACCAPMTSLLSRLTRAPVRVRVKNAIGIFCT